MSQDAGNRSSLVPQPELDNIDSGWDDDPAGEIPLDFVADPVGDRVTAIPEEPPSDYARRAMAGADDQSSTETSDAQPEVRLSKRPTPAAGLEVDPPRLTFDAPDIELGVDDPTSVDEDLELGIGGADEPLPDVPVSHDLELSLDEAPAAPPQDLALVKMRDRYAAGDFTGALILAESFLETDPGNEEAARYVRSCRDVLTQMYAARLGPLDQVVRVAIPPDQVRWLSLDHRTGFLLSLVDGCSSIEEILDISGMTRLDALRIVYTLREQQIVSLTGGSG